MARRKERSRGGRVPEQTSVNLPTESVLRRLFAIDVRSLAAFRIGVGLILLVDLGIRLVDFELRIAFCGRGL